MSGLTSRVGPVSCPIDNIDHELLSVDMLPRLAVTETTAGFSQCTKHQQEAGPDVHQFFAEKVNRIRGSIRSALQSLPRRQFATRPHVGPALSSSDD